MWNQTVAKVIDLEKFRSPGVTLLAGREKGKKVRANLQLDALDQKETTVMVKVPDDVFLASSFFLGMFGPSVRNLGREGFTVRYLFEGANVDLILEDGISEALKYGSALRSPSAAAT